MGVGAGGTEGEDGLSEEVEVGTAGLQSDLGE